MECLIVDDDPLICDLLNHFCEKIADITSITVTNSGFESINLFNNHRFDLIFLDYNLTDMTGREILSLIPETTAVVMITSNREFAAESYDYTQIVDYLIKPIDFNRCLKAVEQAQKYLNQIKRNINQLFIREGNKLTKIDLEDVLFFKAEANYISVVMNEKKILTLLTLKELEKRIPGYFQKVHRSYIVNINKVETIEAVQVKIKNHLIPVSTTYSKALLSKINLLN